MSIATPSVKSVRWRIPVVLAVTVFVNYLDRNNLSLALPRIAADFGWSDREVGANGELLLGAFFLSYAFSNMLLSPVAERFGAKRSVMLAIAAFSLLTFLSAPLGQSLAALISLRLLLGLGEGVHIPMLSAITSRWFPPQERSRANAIWTAGILIATATAPLLLVPLIQAVGWRSMFAVLGIVGMLISIPLVWFFVQDHPAEARQLSSTELAYIQEGQETLFQQGTIGQGTTGQGTIEQGTTEQSTIEQGTTEQSMTQTGYRRDRRFWVATLAGSLNAFCGFGILNWLPTYFNRAKGINFEQLGWPLALVFAAGIVGIFLMAYLGDKFQHRILLASLGFAIAAIMVYIASNATSLGWLVLFFALAVLFQSAYAAQEYAIVQRLLPADRVGAGTGLYNGLTILLGGVGGSLIPGSIVAATGNFNAGMFSIVVGGMLAALVLLGFGRIMRY